MFRDLTQSYKKFDPYLEYYPGPGEEGADGIHDGEIKGLREDAPEDAKKSVRGLFGYAGVLSLSWN